MLSSFEVSLVWRKILPSVPNCAHKFSTLLRVRLIFLLPSSLPRKLFASSSSINTNTVATIANCFSLRLCIRRHMYTERRHGREYVMSKKMLKMRRSMPTRKDFIMITALSLSTQKYCDVDSDWCGLQNPRNAYAQGACNLFYNRPKSRMYLACARSARMRKAHTPSAVTIDWL